MKLRDPVPWISIQYKLPLAFFLVCLVSLGAAGIVGYQATRDILWHEIQRDLLTISQSRAEKVVAYLDMLKKRTEDLSSDGLIRDGAYQLRESPSPDIQEALGNYLRKSKLGVVPEFFEILVTDKKGHVMASSTPANIDLSLAGEPSFKMGQRKTFLGEIQTRGKGTERPLFEIAAPLKDKDNGLLLGVLVNRVNLENLSIQINHKGLTENIFGAGKHVDSFLVNRQGYLLTVARSLSYPDLLLKKRAFIPGAFHGREKQVLTGTSPMDSGKKVLFDAVSIPGTAWTLVTEIETREAFLQATMLQRKLFLVALGMIGMIMILVVFPHKLMIIPLIRLRDAAEKIEKGEFPVSVQGTSNSEMGQLARAFNRLSAGLLERTQSLEQSIAERKRMDERLSRQEKVSVVGKISAKIAHEINNPLASIAMFSQLLDEELSEDSPLREYTEVVHRNILLCKKIVRAFQDYAVESPGERTVFRMGDCLKEVVTLAGPLMEKSGIELTIEVSELLPPYEGDQDQIKQVFSHLVQNAMEAMEAGGALHIRAGLGQEVGEEAQILVEITDTGGGIEEAHLKEIFQPFFSTKAKGRGTGLGLSICQRFVEAHNGQIQVQSKIGCGTTFAISLPVNNSSIDSLA